MTTQELKPCLPMKSLSEIMFWSLHHPNPATRAVYRDIVAHRIERVEHVLFTRADEREGG